jgi:hypothetical protein
VGAATAHDEETRDAGLVFLWGATVDATANRVYAMPPKSLAQAFGGVLPTHTALWVVQNTGQALAASGQALYQQPLQLEIV